MGITVYEMAMGNPPYAKEDPMKAIFLIPRNPPAVLDGDFDRPLKEFVALCLNDDPEEVRVAYLFHYDLIVETEVHCRRFIEISSTAYCEEEALGVDGVDLTLPELQRRAPRY